MSDRILIRDRIITKIDTVKLEKGHFRMETTYKTIRLLVNSKFLLRRRAGFDIFIHHVGIDIGHFLGYRRFRLLLGGGSGYIFRVLGVY